MRYLREFLLMEEFSGLDVFGQPVVAWPEERVRAFRALRLSRAKHREQRSAIAEAMASASAVQTVVHRQVLKEGGR